jgi:hypothetical protein
METNKCVGILQWLYDSVKGLYILKRTFFFGNENNSSSENDVKKRLNTAHNFFSTLILHHAWSDRGTILSIFSCWNNFLFVYMPFLLFSLSLLFHLFVVFRYFEFMYEFLEFNRQMFQFHFSFLNVTKTQEVQIFINIFTLQIIIGVSFLNFIINTYIYVFIFLFLFFSYDILLLLTHIVSF